jgi:TRAP-type C4-dicarboxylate transport system permease small subunit
MSALERIAQLAERASALVARALSAAAAIAVAAIVLVLLFASVQRYALAHPIPATEELAAFLFVAAAFLSVMDGFVQGRHIRLLPLWRRLPAALQGWSMMAGHLFALGVLGVLIRETWAFAAFSRDLGARSYVASLLEWPWMMLIPFSLGALALAILARFLGDFARTVRGERPPEAAEPAAEL